MKHADLPKQIADEYEPHEVKHVKCGLNSGEPGYVITLISGLVHTWRDSMKRGWYQVKHKGSELC